MSVPVRTHVEEMPAPPAGHPGRSRRRPRRRPRASRTARRTGSSGCSWPCCSSPLPLVSFNRLGATQSGGWAVLGALLLAAAIIVVASLTVIQPGRTAVVQFFGRYVGTVAPDRAGLDAAADAPGAAVSLRVRNFETDRLKVNDADGNPVEIAAIVVWQVADTAKAVFAVESTRLHRGPGRGRAAARRHAPTPTTDRTTTDVAARLHRRGRRASSPQEVAARIDIAGVEIIEVRISHLAYAPEIAQAMLQRQQAAAVVAARTRIVEGAVGMVELALDRLSERGIVDLDEERKAAMVSNLLVVLCGDSPGHPGGQHRDPLPVTSPARNAPTKEPPWESRTPADRKPMLLRVDPQVHAALAKWAADDLRSTNAHVEWLLRQALIQAGRLRDRGADGDDARPRASEDDRRPDPVS